MACQRKTIVLLGGGVPLCSRQENEPKPKLLGPNIFGLGGGLPREGVGAERFGMSFELGGARKVREKNSVFNYWTLV